MLRQNPDNKALLAWLRRYDRDNRIAFLFLHRDLLPQVKRVLGLEIPASASAAELAANTAQVSAFGVPSQALIQILVGLSFHKL